MVWLLTISENELDAVRQLVVLQIVHEIHELLLCNLLFVIEPVELHGVVVIVINYVIDRKAVVKNVKHHVTLIASFLGLLVVLFNYRDRKSVV